MTLSMTYPFGKLFIPLSLIDISASFRVSQAQHETNTARAQREDRTRIRRGRVARATLALRATEEKAADELDAAMARAERLRAAAREKAAHIGDKALLSNAASAIMRLTAMADDELSAANAKADELIAAATAAHKRRIGGAQAVLAQAEADLRQYDPTGSDEAPAVTEDLETAEDIVHQQLMAHPPSANDLAYILERYDDIMVYSDGVYPIYTDVHKPPTNMIVPKCPWELPSQSCETNYTTLLDRVAWFTVHWLKIYGGNCVHFAQRRVVFSVTVKAENDVLHQLRTGTFKFDSDA